MPDGSNFLCNNFAFDNNLMAVGNYGFGSTPGMAAITLNDYLSNWSFLNNGFISRPVDVNYNYYKSNPSNWTTDFNTAPLSSFWIDGMAAAGFTNYAGGNYSLTAQSLYHNAGIDGKDLGPDWAALNNAIKNTLTGSAPPKTAAVVGRQIFYADSAFDNPALGFTADNAIATDKQALLPGQQASFANYTSYIDGINGIIIDIDGLADPTQFSIADLQFRMGNDNNPSAWAAAPAPLSITVRPGAGQNGSDRVTITWPDGAITNEWLQVTVNATAITGLAQPDVFYFGNAVGETGNNPANADR